MDSGGLNAVEEEVLKEALMDEVRLQAVNSHSRLEQIEAFTAVRTRNNRKRNRVDPVVAFQKELNATKASLADVGGYEGADEQRKRRDSEVSGRCAGCASPLEPARKDRAQRQRVHAFAFFSMPLRQLTPRLRVRCFGDRSCKRSFATSSRPSRPARQWKKRTRSISRSPSCSQSSNY